MKRIFIFSLMFVMLAVMPAYAANVALFSDIVYVGYDPTFTDVGQEASNLQASLEQLGHNVTPFTGTSAAAWSAAIAGAQVLVVPELENSCSLAADLDAAAVTAILNFVNGGGSLLISEDYCNFLNDIFGYSLVEGGNNEPWGLANASGTAFEGGPASLPYNDDTMDYSSLPAGTTCYYGSVSQCVVFVVSQGSGWVGELGYDWYDAVPIGNQDNGWLDVLDRMMQQFTGLRNTNVPTMNEWGMIVFVLLAGIGSVYFLRRKKIVS